MLQLNSDNRKIFLENKELIPSPSRSTKIYNHSTEESVKEHFELDEEIVDMANSTGSHASSFIDVDAHVIIDDHNNTVSQYNKFLSIPKLNFQKRLKYFRNNLFEKKQTRILGFVCCPCFCICYWPDLLTFILWLIFYIASVTSCFEDNTGIACATNQKARDITEPFWIVFFLFRIIKKLYEQYEYRPRK